MRFSPWYYNKSASFNIVLDSVNQEVYGTITDGTTVVETTYYYLNPTTMFIVDSLVMINDFRIPSYYVGGLYDNFYLDSEYVEPPPPAILEPATMLLLGLGLTGLAGLRRKKMK